MAEPENRRSTQRGALELAAFVGDHQSEQAIKQLTEAEMMTFARVRRGDIRDAIKFVSRVKTPRLLIVDIGGERMVLSDVDSLMNVVEPSTVVVLMGDNNDIALFRDLTMLGVADYILKPVTPELLRRTISLRMGNPSALKPRQRTGKLVAVTGARGGAGTSTFIVNLAWMLSQNEGRRVAVVDLDLQSGVVHLLLGVESSAGLLEGLQNPQRIDDLYVDRSMVHYNEKLSVLADEEPYGEYIEYGTEGLDRLLSILGQRYHYILVDLPRIQGPVYRHVLDQAQIRMVVATPTVPAVRDTMHILKLIGRDAIGQRAMVILNRINPRKTGELARKDFEKAIGRAADFELPYERTAVEADNSGSLIVNRRTEYTRAIQELIDDLSGRYASRGEGSLPRRLLALIRRQG